ncbi:MAG: FAD-dependent oxidoreductase, partial [Planctomycetaceae bacterium]|nr:FAD-dependent oxidoreductase [Planctomycetaceae bacterium]
TSSGVRDLLDEAIHLCPGLADAEVERAWAGLRPGSFDTRPYIGRAPGFANLIVATGHKRAGLQLSPATAEVVADLVLGRLPRIDLTPFRIDREPEPSDEGAFRS